MKHTTGVIIIKFAHIDLLGFLPIEYKTEPEITIQRIPAKVNFHLYQGVSFLSFIFPLRTPKSATAERHRSSGADRPFFYSISA